MSERNDVGAARAGDTSVELLIDDMIRACSASGLTDDDIVAMVEARLEHRKYS